MSDFTLNPPVAMQSWNVSFNGHDPKPRVDVSNEDKSVYYVSGESGATTTEYKAGRKRARRALKDATGRDLYFKVGDSGDTSPNPFTENEDGTTTERTKATEVYTENVRVETPVLDADGNPVLEYASMNGFVTAVDANRRALEKRAALSYADLTETERAELKAIFLSAIGRKIAAWGIHPSISAAEEAGAFNN